MSWRDYLSYDQKVTRAFANTINPLNSTPGVYLIIEILEGFLLVLK